MKHTVIIDTENYSGNFERELCSYITGVETGRGEEARLDFIKTLDKGLKYLFDEYVVQDHDSYDTRKTVDILPTAGWFNHGLGEHFRDGTPENKVKNAYKKAKRRNGGRGGNYTGKHYPSYQSVAIYFNTKPTQDMLDLMESRAIEYCNNNNIVFTSMRLEDGLIKRED